MTRPAPGEDGLHPTYCRLCEALCGLVATVEGGRIAHVGPDRDHVRSHGHLCVKGPALARIAYDPDRVTTPLKRVGGPGEFVAVVWDEALADIAARLKAIGGTHGAGSIGLFIGNPTSFATMHSAFAIGALMAFAPPKIYSPLHVDTGGKMLAQELVYGAPYPFSFPDIERCDFLLMLGANPFVSHMSLITEPLARHRLEAIHARGGVVVVDPRRTETAKRFEHVPILPDTDAWLLAAMLQVIFAEGLHRPDPRVAGWRDLAEAVGAITPEVAAAHCRIPADSIRALARRLAKAERAACYGRVGTNRGSFATLTNVLIEALNLVTGRFGEPGGWIIGRNPINDSETIAFPRYGDTCSPVGGHPVLMGQISGTEMAPDALSDRPNRLRALFIDSANPVRSYPQGQRTAAALDALELVVGIDLYVTETTRHADYILPSVTAFERADINDSWATNAPRPYLNFTDAVIAPVGEARHSYDIYGALLDHAGLPPTFAPGGGERPALFDIVAARFAGRPDGLTLADLARDHPHGLPLAEHVDAARSWEGVAHADGRPLLWHELIGREIARLKATPAPDQRLRLFGRRKLRSLNSWMHNDARIVRSDRPTLLIHPDDARARSIEDSQPVRVASAAGAIEVAAEISDAVIPGSVNYPHGWGHRGGWRTANALGGADVNALASADPGDVEQVSGIPLLDGIPVEVTPLAQTNVSAPSTGMHAPVT